MGLTVRDAALVLTAIAARDPDDPAAAEVPDPLPDYAAGLEGPARLDGVRIGAWRKYHGAGEDPDVERCYKDAIAAIARRGAEVVDPVDLGSLDGLGEAEEKVLFTEFEPDLAAYLAAHGAPNGMTTLADIIAFNTANAERVMPWFGQERFEQAERERGLDDPAYVEALAASKRIARGAIDGALTKERLTAIIAPTNSPAWPTDLVNGDHYLLSSSQLPAVSGYPNVTVPMCFVDGLPVGLSIFGTAWSEPDLLRVAHAFEQETKALRAPQLLPTLAHE
jgi:amidase